MGVKREKRIEKERERREEVRRRNEKKTKLFFETKKRKKKTFASSLFLFFLHSPVNSGLNVPWLPCRKKLRVSCAFCRSVVVVARSSWYFCITLTLSASVLVCGIEESCCPYARKSAEQGGEKASISVGGTSVHPGFVAHSAGVPQLAVQDWGGVPEGGRQVSASTLVPAYTSLGVQAEGEVAEAAKEHWAPQPVRSWVV